MRIPIREKNSYGLIGCPLGHSISPLIHSELFKRSGIVGEYGLIEIEKADFENAVNTKLKKLNGFNVTIPYKTEIIKYLDELSPRAEIFGSVNTVAVKDGKLKGYNTDCVGFTRALGDCGVDLKGDVLILGCGGVSRMFAYESAIAGANITLGVRESSLEKANALKNEIKSKLGYDVEITLIDKIERGFNLILNGTPVGMYPDINKSPVSEEVVKNSRAVFDAIYNPLETSLIKTAEKYGLKNINGLSMLVGQAVAAQEIWNDIEFSKEEINEVTILAKEYLKNE